MERSVKHLGHVGVLMGGYSSEREISLKSGHAVFNALREAGCQVSALDITVQEEEKIFHLIKGSKIDVAFIALHGRLGEDGAIQAILEKAGIPYPGSGVEASRLAINKAKTQQMLKEKNILVAEHISLRKSSPKISKSVSFPNVPLKRDPAKAVTLVGNPDETRPPTSNGSPRYEGTETFGGDNVRTTSNKSQIDIDSIVQSLGLPVVVKPACEGSSIGIAFVQQKEQLAVAIDTAFSYGNEVLVERYIGGKELTVGILDREPLAVIEICPKNNFFDFTSKYQPGMTEYRIPAEISREETQRVQSVALCAHEALGCQDFSRVDLILEGGGNPFVLEINTIPGFTAMSLLPKAAQANGIDFTDLCLKLIQLAYEKKK